MSSVKKYLRFLVISLCLVFVFGVTAQAAVDPYVKSIKAGQTSIKGAVPGQTIDPISLTATWSAKVNGKTTSVLPADDPNVTWAVADEKSAEIVTVSDGTDTPKGTITVIGSGKATVTATYVNPGENAKTVKPVSITVDSSAYSLTATIAENSTVKVSSSQITMKNGSSTVVSLAAKYADKAKSVASVEELDKAEWTPDTEGIVSIAANENPGTRTITFVKPGKTNLTVSYGGKSVKIAIDASLYSLKVYDGDNEVKSSYQLYTQDVKELSAKGVYAFDGKNASAEDVIDLTNSGWVTWTPKTNVVVIDNETGELTASNAPGSTSVTVECGGKSVTFTAKVDYPDKDQVKELQKAVDQLQGLLDSKTFLDQPAKDWIQQVIDFDKFLIANQGMDPNSEEIQNMIKDTKDALRALTPSERGQIVIEVLRHVQQNKFDIETVIELIVRYDIFANLQGQA